MKGSNLWCRPPCGDQGRDGGTTLSTVKVARRSLNPNKLLYRADGKTFEVLPYPFLGVNAPVFSRPLPSNY